MTRRVSSSTQTVINQYIRSMRFIPSHDYDEENTIWFSDRN